MTNVAPGLASITDAPPPTADTALVLDSATTMSLSGQAITNVSAPGNPERRRGYSLRPVCQDVEREPLRRKDSDVLHPAQILTLTPGHEIGQLTW